MKLEHSLTLLVLSAALPAVAQEQPAKEDSRVKPIAPSAFYVSPGLFTQTTAYGSLTDFKTLAPQSALLNDDLSGFQTAHGRLASTASFTSVALGLKFRNKERTAYRNSPELRVGVGYGRSNPLSFYFSKTELTPYDTLSSSQTGAVMYIDSVKRTTYSMSYESENIAVDITAIYRTNPLRRWSLYAGLSCAVGGSLNSYTSIMKYVAENTQTRDEQGGSHIEHGYTFDIVSERYRNKNNASVWASVPMGIDLRIGKKRELLKHVHVYYEARPGMSLLGIPDLGEFTSANLYQALGVRVRFDNSTLD